MLFRHSAVALVAMLLMACSPVPDAAAPAAPTPEASPLGAVASPSPANSPVPTASPSVATATPAPVASVVVRPAPSAVPSPSPSPSPPSEVDTAIAQMTTADKVGQLFMLGFPGADASAALPLLSELRAGGIVLTNNVTTAAAARALTAALQHNADANHLQRLLISANHEGGDVQPIRGVDATYYPPQWELGKIVPPSAAVAAACTRGRVHGKELAAMGINMNLAPDLDVLDNPANTVIGHRAFSSDPQVVARLGVAYIESLQQQGVLAVGKHFPGHGSSTEDSHLGLPVVMHDRTEMDNNELVPFEAAIKANVAAIMVGHLSFPLVDSTPNQPSSLSPVFVSQILRQELKFHGLIVTDDIGQMKAITTGRPPGAVAVQALLAGSDVLLTVGPLQNEREMVQAVIDAVPGIITEERLDASVRNVLIAKIQAGISPGTASSLAPSQSVCS